MLIGFGSAPGPAEQALVHRQGGTVTHTYSIVRAIAATIPEPAITALLNDPRVTVIEPDGRVFALDLVAELDNTWGVKRIGAGTVHVTNTGAGVKIGILDSGINRNHPDLPAISGGWDFVNNDNDPTDDFSHGTHVAGTIAVIRNGTGVVGAAPAAQIYVYKTLNANGSGSFSDVISALEMAVSDGVQVTNNSYGSDRNPGSIVEAAFDNSAASGLVHVAAAGNTGNCGGKGNKVGYPARYASVIAVAATTANDLRPCFSSTGPDVELAAPGTGINSTLLGGGYGTKNGTSMASPHVAGTAGLVIAAGVVDTNGNGIVDEVRDILTSTAEDLGPSGRDSSFGFGLVDAVAAVAAVGPPDPAVHVTLTTDKSTYIIETDTTLTATAVVADELGAAIGGLDSSAFVTVLDGVGVPAVFTETATPGTYTASGDLPAEGAYTLEVTVTSGLLVGTDSATFTVATAPPPGATATVASIEYSTSGGKNRDKHLDIKLTVVDGSDPVSGAVVSIRLDLNGSPYVSGTGTTGTSGQVTFVASNTPGGCYTTTVLDVVAAGLTWDGVIPVAVPSDPLCK